MLLQFINAFNARAEAGSALGPNVVRNRRLSGALAAVPALQVVAVQWGAAHDIFETTRRTATQWPRAAAVGSRVLVVSELRNLIARQR